jgi:hypothetical protein
MLVISRQLELSCLGLVWSSSLPHIITFTSQQEVVLKINLALYTEEPLSTHLQQTVYHSHLQTLMQKQNMGEGLSVLEAVSMCSTLQLGLRKQFYSFTPSCKHHK